MSEYREALKRILNEAKWIGWSPDEIRALHEEKEQLQQENAEQDRIIERLRGQLQNCVNHLESAKRRYPSTESKFSECIESANKAINETNKHRGLVK